MKKIIFVTMFFALVASFSNAQIEMNSTGKVGIGTTPNTSYQLTSSGYNYFSGNVGIGVAPISAYSLNVGGLHVKNTNGGNNIVVFSENSNYGMFIVGTTISGFSLYVNGKISCQSLTETSDERLKKNIQNIDGVKILSKLDNISGRTYQFKNKREVEQYYTATKNTNIDYKEQIPDYSSEGHYGLLAQELEVEFPELVTTDSITGLKGIIYSGMIPILLEAIKAQQQTIDELSEKVTKLTSKTTTTKTSSKTDKAETTDETANSSLFASTVVTETDNSIAQNTPNPFTKNTQIAYNTANNAQNAMICVYNMNGTQLKCYTLGGSGSGNITINGNELTAGMYILSFPHYFPQ